MEAWLRHLRGRDLKFLTFVLTNLLCVAGFLLVQAQTADQPPGGWRSVDLQTVIRRIEAGDLQRHEAAWYHPAREAANAAAHEAP